jgi:predicted nuclease of predicted toxin-antitoxin system
VKLLFDENLSARLVPLLQAEFPGSAHVEHLLGRGRSDDEVWNHARVNGFAIASKDNDFRQRAFLAGPPPKVVWLSVGNAGTDEIATVLRSHADALGRFEANPEEALLVVEAGGNE